MDIYLKAADEPALWAALESAELVARSYDPTDPLNQRPADLDPEMPWAPSGAFTRHPVNIALDVIGTIYKPTGVMVEQGGMQVPEMAAIPGYHANLRGDLTAEQVAMLPQIVPPNAPSRVWAD